MEIMIPASSYRDVVGIKWDDMLESVFFICGTLSKYKTFYHYILVLTVEPDYKTLL